MTKVTKTPRRERKKAAVRRRMIETAIHLFGRHGFDEVTVEHIADVADLGKGTVYNYFQTKEDIVVAYMVEKERQIQARISHLAESKGSVASILSAYIELQFRLKRPYHKFVRVFLAQMFLRTEHFLPCLAEMQGLIDPNLEALFGGLKRRGLLRTDVNIPQLMEVFKTIHLGVTALWAVEGPPFRQTERIVRQEMKLFSEGLEKRR